MLSATGVGVAQRRALLAWRLVVFLRLAYAVCSARKHETQKHSMVALPLQLATRNDTQHSPCRYVGNTKHKKRATLSGRGRTKSRL